jgi:hypothetical protein
VNVILPLPEGATLANPVIAGLHHVHLAKKAVCDIPGFARARDPQEYEEDSLKRVHHPSKIRMQRLVSACVSFDAD